MIAGLLVHFVSLYVYHRRVDNGVMCMWQNC